MSEYIFAFIFFVLVVAAMAIGAILQGKKLQGSCGGLGAIMGDDCEFCDNKAECKDKKKQESLEV